MLIGHITIDSYKFCKYDFFCISLQLHFNYDCEEIKNTYN